MPTTVDFKRLVKDFAKLEGEATISIGTTGFAGDGEMMAKLVTEVDKAASLGNISRPVLLAVTILTSSNEETLRDVGIKDPVEIMVPKLAKLAQKAGLDGVCDHLFLTAQRFPHSRRRWLRREPAVH